MKIDLSDRTLLHRREWGNLLKGNTKSFPFEYTIFDKSTIEAFIQSTIKVIGRWSKFFELCTERALYSELFMVLKNLGNSFHRAKTKIQCHLMSVKSTW
jgi:hypothetical protein